MPTNMPRLAALLACAISLTVACGGGSGTGSGSSPSSAATQSSNSGQVSEDLTTGAISGHMGSAHRGDTYVCAGAGGSFVAGPIVGDVGGKQMAMNITKLSFHGAGSYESGGVSFDVGSDHYFTATGTQSTLVVNADLRAGTVSIDLAANSDPNSIVGHAGGTWRCPPDAF